MANPATESGYTSGGFAPPHVQYDRSKFPFAADANATDVGDLTRKVDRLQPVNPAVVSGYARAAGYALGGGGKYRSISFLLQLTAMLLTSVI